MNASKTSLFHAISILALILSSIAIWLQQQPTPSSTSNFDSNSSSTPELKETISQLRVEVGRLQAQLQQIKSAQSATENSKVLTATSLGDDVADPTGMNTESGKAINALLDQSLSSDERLLAAVEAVMEERGVEYTRAAIRRSEIEESRDKTTEFVDGSLERVPRIIDQVAQEMNLGAARQIQLEDVLLTYSDTAAIITDELYRDPPPSHDETEQIVAEYWQVFGQLGGQLQEVLDEEELEQFGKIVGEIRRQQAEEQQQDN